MAEAPIITGVLRLRDETGDTLNQVRSRFIRSFKDIGSVAGGIIAAEFAQNVTGALEDVARTATDSAAAFELATARIIAALGVTGEEAEALRAELEETAKTLGVEYGVGATAAMEALESLVKAGLEGEEAVQALAGVLQLATIEGISTAEAANMVVQAMTQFGLSAQEATRVVDGFVKASAAGIDTASGYASGLANVGATAHAMGLSLEETLAALVQLDNTFGSAQVSGTYLNRMLLDLAEKADKAGINLYRADGSMKSMTEIVEELRARVKSFGDDQAALNEWLNLFDTRAAKAILALVQYDETLGETQSRMEEMAGATEAVGIILDTYAGQMAKTRAQKELVAIEAGKLTTQIGLLGAQLTAALGPVGLLADALGPSMLSGVMQGLTVAVIPQLIGKLGGLSAALGGVGNIIPSLAGLIGAAGPLGLALAGIAVAIGVFALAWSQNWFGIRDKTKAAIDAILGAFRALKNWIEALGRAWSSFWRRAKEKAEEGSRGITGSLEAVEYGRSPGGLRDVMRAILELGSTWNRVIEGLRRPPDIGPLRVSVEAESPRIRPEVEEVVVKPRVEKARIEAEAEAPILKPEVETPRIKPDTETPRIRPLLELPDIKPIKIPVEAETPVIKPIVEPPEIEAVIPREVITRVITPTVAPVGFEPPRPGPGVTAGFEPARNITLVFQEGAIQFIEPRLEGSMDRAAIAREIVELLGKEMLRRR